MYRIKFIPKSKMYQIHSSYHGAFEGNLEQITIKALEMGLDSNDLTFAYNHMRKEKHTIAEFGINGFFIYSHNGKKVA